MCCLQVTILVSILMLAFFSGFSNKRLFPEAYKIIFFISFPYHIGLVYMQADTKSIKCVLVLSLLIDWSFLLVLKSCLDQENYSWWVVSNVCTWADNEHNLSTRINQLLLLTGIVSEIKYKLEISLYGLHELCLLLWTCKDGSVFPMTICFLLPLTLLGKCNGFPSYWVCLAQHTLPCRLGQEVIFLPLQANISQLWKTVSPWDYAWISQVIHF